MARTASFALLVAALCPTAYGVKPAAHGALRHQAAALPHVALQNNATKAAKERFPFNARVDPAVGKVFSLYYSSHSDAKATSVEVLESYAPADRVDQVWSGPVQLPEPPCNLQLRSQTNHPTDRRKANLRLAELAVCQLLELKGQELPGCGANETAKEHKACELTVHVPMPSNDEQQEPYIGAAIALAAYSKVCALGSKGNEEKCEVHRSETALCAGLDLIDKQVHLKNLPSPGLLDLKLDDAYILKFNHVYLAASNEAEYEETNFYNNLPNPLKWSHGPPEVHFCDDLDCLADHFMATR